MSQEKSPWWQATAFPKWLFGGGTEVSGTLRLLVQLHYFFKSAHAQIP